MHIEKVFGNKKYRSIICLTNLYEGNEGLRQLHYRWALIKNHDNIESWFLIREVNKCFKNTLDLLLKKGFLITKDCFTSNNNLSNYLERLSDKDGYNILEKNSDNKPPTYKLSENGKLQFTRWLLIDYINRMSLDFLEEELHTFMMADFEAIKEIIEEIKPKK